MKERYICYLCKKKIIDDEKGHIHITNCEIAPSIDYTYDICPKCAEKLIGYIETDFEIPTTNDKK